MDSPHSVRYFPTLYHNFFVESSGKYERKKGIHDWKTIGFLSENHWKMIGKREDDSGCRDVIYYCQHNKPETEKGNLC